MDLKDIKGKLTQPLFREYISNRTQSNRTLSYVEGHHAIREANDIFGCTNWNLETIYNKEVCRYEVTVGKGDYAAPGSKVGYEAKVRISIHDDAGNIIDIKEGTGHGSGIAKDLFDAIEGASKEAETDAMKRALKNYGDRFGLSLYDKEQLHTIDKKDFITYDRTRDSIKGFDPKDKDEWDLFKENIRTISKNNNWGVHTNALIKKHIQDREIELKDQGVI